MRSLALVCALAACAAACGHHAQPAAAPDHVAAPAPADAAPPPPPPSPDAAPVLSQDPAAFAGKLVELFEALGAATSTGDCAAMAAAIDGLRASHADVLDAAHKLDAAGRKNEVEAAMEPYKARVKAAMEAIEAHTATCQKDPAVEHAIDALFAD